MPTDNPNPTSQIATQDVTDVSASTSASETSAATPQRTGGRRKRKQHKLTAIERHPRRAEIETAIANGISLRSIGKRFELDFRTVWYHKKRMQRQSPGLLSALAAESWEVPVEELDRLRVETSAGWLQQLRAQYTSMKVLQDACAARGDHGHAASYATRAITCLRLLGDACGEIASHSVKVENNFIVATNWVEFRSWIAAILQRHPAAFQDFMAGVAEMERKAFTPVKAPAVIDARPQ